MVKSITGISLRKAAIISGISILMMTIVAVVATDLTIGNLFVPDNPVATLKNINLNLV